MELKPPPRYTVDLSLAPSQRYVQLALDFKEEIHSLTGLFDELVQAIHPRIPVRLVKGLARTFLTRVNSREENEELRGISRAISLDFYLLVALNVLLDLLMGCTSGAARTRESPDGEDKMLHFRTLDWGMDELRKVVVQLDFVRSPNTEVIATSITYAGFVGVLTGVRKSLSLSLNFRANHYNSKRSAEFRFYGHLTLVLLGLRPSISSHLRQTFLPSSPSDQVPSIAQIEQTMPSIPTTAAFLTFSDGTRTIALEKDHRTALIRSSTTFIVTTNHDVCSPPDKHTPGLEEAPPALRMKVGMADLIEESTERRDCMLANWEKKVRHARRSQKRNAEKGSTARPSQENTHAMRTRSRTSCSDDIVDDSSSMANNPEGVSRFAAASDDDLDVTATQEEIIKWLEKYPVTNECTHFACILDPTEGRVAWLQRHMEPVETCE